MTENGSFTNFIKDLRKNLGYTQEELAHRVGCAPITLRRIESASLRPSVQISERLAMALDIPLNDRVQFVQLARSSGNESPSPIETPIPQPSQDEIGRQDLTGRAIRGYELGDRLGQGAFGIVYRAVQPGVDREVAVKIILPRYANQPEFIRRFEAEAQLVARLEHPFIVPLYDYWREPNAAYLVMRLLRGGNLEKLLEEGAFSPNQAMRFLEQIGSSLHSAHCLGVIHRDIKPANILLDEEQNAYLGDFGVAKNLGEPNMEQYTEDSDLVGSWAYLCPEQIRSESVQPQADIYALGILTYQLLTGKTPFRGPSPIEYIQQHLTFPLPLLAEHKPNLQPEFDIIIQRATAKEPADRYVDVLSFLREFKVALGGAEEVIQGWVTEQRAELENPFKGLRAFQEADTDDFFGRENLIQELLSKLTEENALSRFLAVVGPSGSGKSSVVRAGLIPSIRRGGLPGSENWFITDMIPGRHPFEELEAALLRVAVNPIDSLLEQLTADERGLARAVRRVLPADSQVELLLVIDQFEELFTLLKNEEDRIQFLDSLVTAVLDEDSRVRVVITMRADFTDRPLGYVDFGDLMRQRTTLVMPLTPDEMELAINGPTRRVGLITEKGLVSRIVRELVTQPGTLPLLQYTLTELYERKDGRRLTLKAYDELGGVLGALGVRAEEAFAGLAPPEQQLARQIFLRLVTLGEGVEDTRRRVLRSELEGLSVAQNGRQNPAAFDIVIRTFEIALLLTFDYDPATRHPTIEVAHEALLREWTRLRSWLDESRVDMRMQRALSDLAADWNKEQDPSFLLRGTRLEQFRQWAGETSLVLTDRESSYLKLGIAEEEKRETERREQEVREQRLEKRSRRILTWLVGVLAVATVGALLLSNFAFGQRDLAEEEALARSTQQVIAEEQAAIALAEADARSTQQTIAEAEANARATQQAIAEEERAIAEANEFQALYQASIAMGSQAQVELEGAFSERAVPLALEALENYPYTWQAENALSFAVVESKLRFSMQHDSGVQRARWSPDNLRIISASDDGTAKIWDASSGELLLTLEPGHDMILNAEWSPDGKRVTLTGFDGNVTNPTPGTSFVSIWDSSTGEMIFELDTNEYLDARWSRDGSQILTFGDLVGNGAVWDARTGDLVFKLGEAEGAPLIPYGGWSPDGSRILTGSWDGTAKVWDAKTGNERLTLIGPGEGKIYFAWSPDGSRIATGYEDGTVKIWDAETGETIYTLGTAGGLARFDWSPSGAQLLTWGYGFDIAEIWDMASGTLLYTLSGHGMAIAGRWSPDGNRIATTTSDARVFIWDAKSGTEIRKYLAHTGDVGWIEWSHDGKLILTSSLDGTAKVWDTRFGLVDFGNSDIAINCIALNNGDRIICSYLDGSGEIFDSHTGESIQKIEFLGYGPEIHDVSPDGNLIIGGDYGSPDENLIRIWDANTGEILPGVDGPTGFFAWLRISPDGSKIAQGDWFPPGDEVNKIRIWDIATGALLNTFDVHSDNNIFMVDWSPDGTKLASSSYDGNVFILDAQTGDILHDLVLNDTGVDPYAVEWSRDGSKLIAGFNDAQIRIWDTETGEELLAFTGHDGKIFDFSWSPSGDRVLSGSEDGTARVWDVATGIELYRYNFHARMYDVEWFADGNRIQVGNVIYPVWNTTQELINYAKECCFVRDLTPNERELFGLPAIQAP